MAIIALIGAGGKMGCRISDNLVRTDHKVYYAETGERGLERLRARGLSVTDPAESVPEADIVILAVPDTAIREVSADIVPKMKTGAMLMLLDPAAAYVDHLPKRADIAYFVAHPCHPPIFGDETEAEARKDYFGGVSAKQAIVCALVQTYGEGDYDKGENVAKEIFAPVMRSHRLTLGQMATLEPTMAETIGAAVAVFLRSAMDQAVHSGVPAEAARDFMLGHIHIELAIAFGEAGNPFSDACLAAIEYGRNYWLKPGWQALFEPASVKEQIEAMLAPGR